MAQPWGTHRGQISLDTHNTMARPQFPVPLLPAFPQLTVRAVLPPSSYCRETSTPVHHPAQHRGSNSRSKSAPKGNCSGSAWEGNPERSHNLHIHPRLGGRNFYTSEQAGFSQGSAEAGAAAGTLPAKGKRMSSPWRAQWPCRLWVPA